MITEDKITEIFCIADDFCKYFSSELKKHQIADGKKHRNKSCKLGSRGDYNPHTIPQQGIQMPQTLLYAVCVQAYATPVSANRII